MNGFKNFNNTCFIDSIMQAIFHIPSFIEFMTKATINCSLIDCTQHLYSLIIARNENREQNDSVTKEFIKLCKKSDFLSQLANSIDGFQQQQDCCEFLESY